MSQRETGSEHGSALEMCMVFEYHELGSLDNYLYSRPVDVPTAARMIYSMASGLAFLHSAMETTAQSESFSSGETV